MNNVSEIYGRVIEGLRKEDVKTLNKTAKKVDDITKRVKYVKDHINVIVEKLREESIDSGYYFVQVVDYLREMVHSIEFIVKPALNHVDNNHKPLIKEQFAELEEIKQKLELIIDEIKKSIQLDDFSNEGKVIQLVEDYRATIESIRKKQIVRVKKKVVGTKNSILYFDIISESKNIGFHMLNLYKSQRDFVNRKNTTI